ncbi:MAG: hypothetical protein WA364_24365 [Candidatus Nitrosopolaris sp.]
MDWIKLNVGESVGKPSGIKSFSSSNPPSLFRTSPFGYKQGKPPTELSKEGKYVTKYH